MGEIDKNINLISDIKSLIEKSRQEVAITVNSAITLLYWQIGKRINEEVLKNQRAAYGKEIIASLSRHLGLEYGKGWSEKHLRHCLTFADIFPDLEIVSTLWRQLSWSHIKELIYMEDAILIELQKFIIELGSDFAFMARQKRITIDNEDYYLDLLFYHRRLNCLVVIELKLGKFEPAHKGQMELYLRWLEKYEVLEGENPPIGLILCAAKNHEHVELLQLESSNIKVAEYLTKLPDIKILEQKLRKAIEIAKQKHPGIKLMNEDEPND